MKPYLSGLIVAAGLTALAIVAPSAASATQLHGFCVDPTPGACADNGANTPTALNPPEFGFTSGGTSESGDLLIGILVPNDISPPASFTIENFNNTSQTWTATPLSTTTSWTHPPTNELGAYMTSVGAQNITDGNGHPISAFLTSTQTVDASATGFWVYVADLGPQTLQTNANALSGLELTLSGQLPVGAWLLGFLCQGENHTSCLENANSAGIIEEGPNCPDCHVENVPEPITLSLFGVGLVGAAAARGLRRKAKAA